MPDAIYRPRRAELVAHLRATRGIRDERVLEAIGRVPRHRFVESSLAHRAYEDVALPIGAGQTISQPFTVAYMTQSLGLRRGDRVLEIGTGSGYQAAVLLDMGVRVFSVERVADLLNRTRALLDELGCELATRLGDGTVGWNEFAPYDGILVTAGAPKIPPALIKQLKLGARLVIPVGDDRQQDLHIVERTGDGETETTVIAGFRFVPLIGRDGWKV